MTKRPSFQFYPADWRNDAALRMCAIAARGLWWEMICVMHTCEPYGHLMAAGRAIEPEELARIVGENVRAVKGWLAELEQHQVFSRTPEGVIYCRRMVQDQRERDNWGDRQRKSRACHADVTGIVTPSVTAKSQLSSSSSSSSPSEEDSPLEPPQRGGAILIDQLPTRPKRARANGGRAPPRDVVGERVLAKWIAEDEAEKGQKH